MIRAVNIFRINCVVVSAVAAFSSSHAQDVTYMPPAWMETKDAPDELPVIKTEPRVEFPKELRGTPDLGYVIFDLILAADGKVVGLHPHASHPDYERVSHVVKPPRTWSPGRREGKGVNTETAFGYIFNPASASEKNSTSTPRLIEVEVVRIVEARKLQTEASGEPKQGDPKAPIPDQIIFADVSVDASGQVTEVKNAPETLARAMSIAAKNWRFAPARRDGQPVAAEARAPFIVVTERGLNTAGGKRVQPRVTSQAKPIYPFMMRASGLRGEVLVSFVVTVEGRVRDAYVVRTLNPSFDDAALEAVRKWRFEPGRIQDRFVNTRMQVPMVFAIEQIADGGEGPFVSRRGKADQSKLPPEFRYDTPPRPSGSARPVYPYELFRDGKEGRASVGFVVGPSGQVIHTQISEESSPEFGRALQAAVENFTFYPALKDGRSTQALQAFEQKFDRDERWQLVTQEDFDLLRREKKKPESIVTLKELDGKLTPTSRKPIAFPLSTKQDVGEAMVEFLVDEDGRVRLPRIISATEEAFGYAAVQSVAAWRFEPPQRGGKAVVVRARLPIRFKRDVK